MNWIDKLESRTLLSGDHGFGHHLRIPQPPDAAVQADLDKSAAERTQLQTDRANLRSTLQTDRQAIRTAIEALDSTLAPLRTTFQTDAQTWRATIQADRQKLRTDRENGVDTTADKTQLKTDRQAAWTRSEERRVGKEGRERWARYP